MLEKYQDIELNKGTHRFEIIVDGFTSFIEYEESPNRIALLHTEVPKELEGHGVAAALVEKTFHYIEEHNLRLLPYCPYVASFLRRHPEWRRILETEANHL